MFRLKSELNSQNNMNAHNLLLPALFEMIDMQSFEFWNFQGPGKSRYL